MKRYRLARWNIFKSRPAGLALLCLSLVLPSPVLLAQVAPNRLPNLGDGAEMNFGSERRIGDSIAREIYQDPDYIDDPVLQEYVESVWHTLLNSSRQRGELLSDQEQAFAWQVMLIRDRSINAFALPGGYMGIHLGLIAAVTSTDEMASVLAHELTHITQRHIARSIGQQGRQSPLMIGAMIAGALVATRAGGSLNAANAAQALMVGGPAAAMQSQLNFSRDMEREADRIGYSVMTNAGYDPQGFVTMFEKLQQASRLNDNGGFPYLRSHPMTTERIADAQARQQLLPAKGLQVTTSLHAMMAARASVLVNPGIDGLRNISGLPEQSGWSQSSASKQINTLYAATLADIKMREWNSARQHLTRLQALPGLDAAGKSAVQLLSAELFIARGEGAQALRLLDSKALNLAARSRPVHLMLAQARIQSRQAAEAQLVRDDMQLWLSEHPNDALAWSFLALAFEVQGDTLRAVRAQAEVRAVQYDFSGAVDRLKAAQELVRNLSRQGRLDNANQMEASIIDARLHALEELRREQALQR